MTDTRIATEYLKNLFERLSAGYISGDQHDPDLDPDCVDWSFAAECWLAVMRASEKSREEHDELRIGIQSIIRQCLESAVMGGHPEDLEAVADELEELLEAVNDD